VPGYFLVAPSQLRSAPAGRNGREWSPSAATHLAGGEDELISSLKNVKVTKPEHADPLLQAGQTELRQQVARGAADAQQELVTAARGELESKRGCTMGCKGNSTNVPRASGPSFGHGVIVAALKWPRAEPPKTPKPHFPSISAIILSMLSTWL
jgi:hypothetical protein